MYAIINDNVVLKYNENDFITSQIMKTQRLTIHAKPRLQVKDRLQTLLYGCSVKLSGQCFPYLSMATLKFIFSFEPESNDTVAR